MTGSRLVGEHFTREGKPKRRFTTREEAEAHAERYGYQHLMIYQCSICRDFHFATRRGQR
jgi:hypothetical protein